MFGWYLFLLASKTFHKPPRSEVSWNSTALQTLFSKSRPLWEFLIWQRARVILTRVHISAVLISVIKPFLFTAILWEQGTNNEEREKDTDLNAWL